VTLLSSAMLSLSITTWCVTSLIITIPLGLYAYFRHLMRGILRHKTIEGATDYERDLVYLHQFPRCIAKQVPNMSPFALKLETWLRLRKIKYKVSKRCFYIPYAMAMPTNFFKQKTNYDSDGVRIKLILGDWAVSSLVSDQGVVGSVKLGKR